MKQFSYSKRILISLLVGLLLGVLISEGSFYMQQDRTDADLQQVEIIIPAGTAEKIALGQAQPSIPENISFTTGDLLIVRNQDSVSHQLGPVWVPPFSSGVLELSQPDNYALNCSFQVSSVMGVDVRPRITTGIRIQGILAVAIPTAILVGLYSLAIGKPRAVSNDV